MSFMQKLTCDICEKTFEKRRNLNLHIRKIHRHNSSLIIYACDICEKTFTKLSSLKTHMIEQHQMKEKKFECSVCKQRLSLCSLNEKGLVVNFCCFP